MSIPRVRLAVLPYQLSKEAFTDGLEKPLPATS